MTQAPLTFPMFQATGRDVADLRDALPEFEDREIYAKPVPGRLYTESDLCLQADAADSAKPWYFEFGMDSLAGTLAEAEAELYAVYLDEVLTADHPQYAELRAAAPANRYWRTAA